MDQRNHRHPPGPPATVGRHPALRELDPKTAFLYTPRTLSFLLIGFLAVVYLSGTLQKPVRPMDEVAMHELSTANAKQGVWAVIFVFLGYSILQGPATQMVRPHPSFWRLVHGTCVVYFLFLVWMLFQDIHDARLFMKHLSGELGVDLAERAYGADCSLWDSERGIHWNVIKDTVWDEFVIAHTFGWWFKAVMVRDHFLLWVLSVSFEVMELTFQHMLPNFNECWWDSWILDVAVCNLIGIVTGMWSVHWFECRYKTYNWRGISQQPTIIAKAKRSILQFMPYSWDIFDWQIFSGPGRCLQVLAMVLMFLTVEVQSFFLKYILWIPPRNLLNTYRLVVWFVMGLPAIREYFEFLEGHSWDHLMHNKLGPFAWLAAATSLVEFLICLKFGQSVPEFQTPWPRKVLVAWGIIGTLFASLMLTWSLRRFLQISRERKERKSS
ncbi:hypothetical protein BSKO_06431 [Bryopsis sp. KO-2023]|nr:hypothetical protein BSKO_06431 [Bryopsis sp. KO-2023]